MNAAPMSGARPHLAVSIAVFRNGRVLLATRTRPPFAGLFSLPGGHVEAGENLSDAALRELAEETGVEARLIGFNQYIEFIAPESDCAKHFVILSFVGIWRRGEGAPGREAGEILWAYPEDIANLKTSPYLGDVVLNAREILAQNREPG